MNLHLTAMYLLLHVYAPPLTAVAVHHAALQEAAPRHFKFERGPSGRTMGKGGIVASFSRFTSEDGTVVERFVEDHKTAQAARAALDEKRKRSLKITQDGYRYGAHGERIGRRVVLLLPGRTKAAAGHVEIVWTNGALLYVLRSESQDHLLDFEWQAYPSSATRN